MLLLAQEPHDALDVALDDDGLLDRDDVMLEDNDFPGAAAHAELVDGLGGPQAGDGDNVKPPAP